MRISVREWMQADADVDKEKGTCSSVSLASSPLCSVSLSAVFHLSSLPEINSHFLFASAGHLCYLCSETGLE